MADPLQLYSSSPTYPFGGYTERGALSEDARLHSHSNDDGVPGVEDELGEDAELTGEHSYVSGGRKMEQAVTTCRALPSANLKADAGLPMRIYTQTQTHT